MDKFNNKEKINSVIDSTITDFNTVLHDFIELLAKITPRSTLSNNTDTIFKVMKAPRFRTVFINKFVKHILIYKSKFDENNDEFFLDDKFVNKVLKNDELKTNLREVDGDATENTIMTKIFEFKQYWSTFSKENKEYCFSYMQTLCALAEDYFLLEDENR